MLSRLGFRAPLLVEHEVTESVIRTGPETFYWCAISIGTDRWKTQVASANSSHSATDAKQKAYEEFGKIVDQYLRVYDRLTEEMRGNNAG